MIWGLAALFTEGMILEKWGVAAEESKYRMFFKPLILCPPCMSSVYGVLASFYFHYDLSHLIVLILGTCGLNYIIANK